MQRIYPPFRALRALVLPLGALLLSSVPSFAAGATPIEIGPLAGTLALPSGWEPKGKDLAAKLLEQDGVREPPVLAFLKDGNQIVFATTKVIQGITLTAAALAGGGPDLARAIGIEPSAMQCSAFPHPSGDFDFSICETVAKGTGFAVTGKGKQQTSAIWVDIPIAYEGSGGVTRTWTSIYFRGPGSARASGREVVESLLDALTLKPGLRIAEADTAAAIDKPEPRKVQEPVVPPPASALAELLVQGMAEKPTPANIAALRSVSETYSGTALGEVATELARSATSQVALSSWEELLALNPGDAQLRSLALRFFGAALRTSDHKTMQATATWLASQHVKLAELQPQELSLIFPAGDLCALSWGDLEKPVHDLGALDSSRIDASHTIADLFRRRGLAVPDVSRVAVEGKAAVWRPRGEHAGAMPQLVVADGRLGALTPKDPVKLKAGYQLEPLTNIFDALDSLCRAKLAR